MNKPSLTFIVEEEILNLVHILLRGHIASYWGPMAQSNINSSTWVHEIFTQILRISVLHLIRPIHFKLVLHILAFNVGVLTDMTVGASDVYAH